MINSDQELIMKELNTTIQVEDTLLETKFKDVETTEMINRKMNALLENDEEIFDDDNNIFGLLTYDDDEDEEDEEDAEEAFTLELIKQEYSDSVILLKLQENFNLTDESARLKLVSVYNSLKLLTSTFNSKKTANKK